MKYIDIIDYNGLLIISDYKQLKLNKIISMFYERKQIMKRFELFVS